MLFFVHFYGMYNRYDKSFICMNFVAVLVECRKCCHSDLTFDYFDEFCPPENVGRFKYEYFVRQHSI